jgi:hypothetical protein
MTEGTGKGSEGSGGQSTDVLEIDGNKFTADDI